MLTHANMVETGDTLIKSEDVRLDDDWLAYLPMAWVGDSLYTLVMNLMVGFTRQLPGEPRDRPARPARARAHRGAGPAADLGEHADRRAGARRRRPAPQALGVRALLRRRRARGDSARRRASRCRWACGWRRMLGEFFVYGPVRDQLGLLRARWAYTGGAPLGPGHLPVLPLDRRQSQAGLRLHRARPASSRCSPTPRPTPPPRAGRAPASRCGSRERGEVLVQERGRLQGLLQERRGHPRGDRPATGWFHTGDAGFVDPRGHLVIIDRAKDVGALADGTAVRAAVHREQAEVQPLHPRGGRLRARAARRDRDDRHRSQHRGQLGRAPGRGLHLATRTSARSRRCASLIREEIRAGQRDPAGGAEGPALPAADQGPGGRRRGDDAHPQGPAPARGREVRAGHRRLLLGRDATSS